MVKRIAVSVLILAGWMSTTGVLFQKEIRPFFKDHAISQASLTWDDLQNVKDYWMGIYFEGQKIGFTHVWSLPLESAETRGYQMNSETRLNLFMLGESRVVDWKSSARLDAGMQPAAFDFDLKSGGYQTRFSGEHLAAGNWRLQINGFEQVLFAAEVDGKKNPLPSPAMGTFLSLKRWQEGEVIRFPVYDPFTQNESEIQVRAAAKHAQWKNSKSPVTELEVIFNGLSSRLWISEEGEILQEESPLGFVTIREEMSVALDLADSDKIFDLASHFSIPVAFTVNDPRALSYMKLKMRGLDWEQFFPESSRQKILDKEEGLVEIRRPRQAASAVLGEDERAAALRATPFIQSDAAEIKELSARITRSSGDDKGKVKAILQWMAENIQPFPSMSVPSSLDVLRNKKGDCNEYTALFTALSRAAGIPTRMLAGLLYLEGYFYYHAWPEVFLQDWIAVDPTLKQENADAAHIALLTGDMKDQMQILQILGKIKIEIIEAKEEKND